MTDSSTRTTSGSYHCIVKYRFTVEYFVLMVYFVGWNLMSFFFSASDLHYPLHQMRSLWVQVQPMVASFSGA